MLNKIKNLLPSSLKTSLKKMIGKYPAGRFLTVRDSDIFIVSYPKSGNTWTRFLIGNLLYEEGVDFSTIEKVVPDIYINSNSMLERLASPRILKSHEYFDPRYKKVIYIARDPRDVAVSYLSFAKKHGWVGDDENIDNFVDKFLSGSVDGFGTWGQNVGSWIGAMGDSKEFLLLRYEDLLVNTNLELEKVAKFVGLVADQTRIAKAVEMSSFNRMKQLEEKQSTLWGATKNSRKDIPFMRSGESGGWRNKLSKSVAQRISDTWGDVMARIGYLD